MKLLLKDILDTINRLERKLILSERSQQAHENALINDKEPQNSLSNQIEQTIKVEKTREKVCKLLYEIGMKFQDGIKKDESIIGSVIRHRHTIQLFETYIGG